MVGCLATPWVFDRNVEEDGKSTVGTEQEAVAAK
jgi:hypothetical protein